MNLELTEEQQLVRASVREFCEKYVEPAADAVDQEPRFPSENVKRLAEQDWLGIPYPEEYGGAGADYLTHIIAVEELTKEYQILAKSSMKYLEIGLVTALLYLLMSVPLGHLSRYLEKRWGKGR